MKLPIYLDYQATTPVDPRVLTYSIICNEYCGINHHTMASMLFVVKPTKK